MEVILREHVDNLGKRGEVVKVADGYARNYLIPKGLAMKASAGAQTQAASMRRARDVRDARDREAAREWWKKHGTTKHTKDTKKRESKKAAWLLFPVRVFRLSRGSFLSSCSSFFVSFVKILRPS